MGNQVNPTTKKEERVKRKSENSKKFGHRSKGKGWPKEKELLDKGDGLATAAGARLNDEVTSQCIYKHTRERERERDTHTHTHLQVHSLKKGVSENEAPGPVGAYTTTHNNTPTPMPDRLSKLRTTTFDQECSFCREESGS